MKFDISQLEAKLELSRHSLQSLTYTERDGIPEGIKPTVKYLRKQEGRRLDDFRRELRTERLYLPGKEWCGK